MSKNVVPVESDDFEVIFRPFITLKNGQRIYAKAKGRKAFALRVKKRK